MNKRFMSTAVIVSTLTSERPLAHQVLLTSQVLERLRKAQEAMSGTLA